LDWIGLDWIGLDWIGLDCKKYAFLLISATYLNAKEFQSFVPKAVSSMSKVLHTKSNCVCQCFFYFLHKLDAETSSG